MFITMCSLKSRVVVNLVRNQIEVVFQAEVGDAFQLLFGPYTAYRVVRAAQHEGFGVWSDALFHVLKVDGVVAVVVDQRLSISFLHRRWWLRGTAINRGGES